jgi:hypothetical protein
MPLGSCALFLCHWKFLFQIFERHLLLTRKRQKITPEARFDVIIINNCSNSSLSFIAGKVEKIENSGRV